jgi:prepilin signal peptidase PulO-like enzyme (type II secretory pathway)
VAAAAAKRRALAPGRLALALPLIAAAFAYGAASAGSEPAAVAAIGVVVVAGLLDARTGTIVDPLTGAFAVTALALRGCTGSVPAGVAGAAAVGGVLLVLHVATRGGGIGLGDVKLGAGIGLALGAPAGLTAFALAFIAGGAWGAWLLITGRAQRGSLLRFGPFIAAGTCGALMFPALGRP